MLPSFDQAVPVDRVAEEYVHIGAHPCPACGGRWKVRMQALMKDAQGHHYDRVDVVCAQCGERKAFLFDVTCIFDRYPVDG